MADLRHRVVRNGPLVALGLFSVVPAPVVTDLDAATVRRAMLSLPWLGLAFGGAAAGLGWLVHARGAGMALAAVVALAVPAVLTGALHLDGLADTADGLGSRRPAAEALQVMRRSDIGPMGVVTLVLVLLLDAAALCSPSLGSPGLVGAPAGGRPLVWATVALMPLVARTGVLLAARRGLPGARESGFGALVLGTVSPLDAAVSTLAVLLACGGLGWWCCGMRGAGVLAGAAVLALLVDAVWRRHLVRRLGGMTGDTFGSLAEAGQLAFLLAAALLA